MDQAGITQQYYIAARSSPADDRAKVLKYGRMFSIFDHLGDMETSGLGEQGLFFQGTRHLSRFKLCLWNGSPLLLSSAIKANNFLFTANLSNLDVSSQDRVAIPRGTLHVQRSKFLWHDVSYEELAFINYGLSALTVPFSLEFDADFADIFEVRGMQRPKRGERLKDSIEKNMVRFSYEGLDGKVRQTCLRSDPAPRYVSAQEMRFELRLKPGDKAHFHLETSCDSQSDHRFVAYSEAIVAARHDQKTAFAMLPAISSSNSRLTDWVQRSAADIEMMIIGNPETDYPYAGVPWFSTVFGRDGIITALQTLWLCPRIARGVLQYLAQTQAKEFNPAMEAEPGKILHETRSGEMAALGEVPFGRYYGTIDATPLFIVLAGAYYERTGDLEGLRNMWPHIDLALQWIDKFGDMDGDGFVEYARRSSNGLVQQGWKDSNDSVFHADGNLAEAPIALCEVQGYVYAALQAAARMSCALGDKARSKILGSQAEILKVRFDEAFWCEDISTYALALDRDKKPCRVRTSNAGHCLFAGIARPERASRIAETLLSPDSFTGWGIRTLAAGEARYNPLSYHNGSIWPHDNSLIASGLARYGCKLLAGRVLLGLLDASRWADLARLPELFCGLDRQHGEGPTKYPVACSPQAWASGAVFMLLEACLGVSVQAESKKVLFDRPYLPDGIPQLWIKGLQVGDGTLDLFCERHKDGVRVEVSERQGEVQVVANL